MHIKMMVVCGTLSLPDASLGHLHKNTLCQCYRTSVYSCTCPVSRGCSIEKSYSTDSTAAGLDASYMVVQHVPASQLCFELDIE